MTSRPHPRQDPEPRTPDVAVVILEGDFLSTAIAPIEVFYSAGVLWNQIHGQEPEPRFRVRTASVDGAAVGGVCSLQLRPGLSIAEIERTDLFILSAAGWDAFEGKRADLRLLDWLRAMNDRGTRIAGICPGVAILAECGLLDGRRATTHWGGAEAVRELYPKVL